MLSLGRGLRCFLLLLAAVLFCGGCASSVLQEEGAPRDGRYTVTDDAGRQVTLEHKPRRIVSLTYGTDEILTALVEPSRIAAYSKRADDPGITFLTPQQAQAVPGRAAESTEGILAQKPDLVLASAATDTALVELLANLGVPVYVASSPKNYEQMRQKVLGVARAVGEERRGQEELALMDSKLNALEKRLSELTPERQRVAVAFTFSGPMGKPGNLFAELLQLAHIKNGAAAGGETAADGVVSKEQVISADPDVFLLPTWNFDGKKDVQGFKETLLHDPAYAVTKAVQNGRLEFVSDKYRYVASQHLPEAVEALARAVYPEYFRGDGA